jgi:membrane protein YqaA with SNARE-associated domain
MIACMAMDASAALFGLFVSAFLSSTLLPGSSEVVLAALVASTPELTGQAVAFATIGNTLGGLTSYGIGRLLPQPAVAPRSLVLARRWGVPALLLSWVPVVGDALCVASGWLRQNLAAATLAIAAGKLARYVVLAGGVRLLVPGT